MQRRFYYYVRAGGFMAANEALREGAKLARQAGATDTPQAYLVCLMRLGALLYQRLPSDLIKPTRCLDLLHRFGQHDRKLTVVCRSLQARGTQNGTAYFSRRMPRIRFHDIKGDWVVAFFTGSRSRHALDRICERTVYDWRTYGGHGDAFAFFDNCVYFEDCTAVRGEPSFVVWNSCVPHHASWHYVEQVLGERVTLQGDYYEDVADARKSRRFYYRVGYCPVEFHGDLAVATTLLVPGMEGRLGTPEGKLIGQSGLPADKVAEKRDQRERQLSMKDLIDGGDFSLVKWFHNNGIAQVVEFKYDVFKYDCETPQGWRVIGDGGRTIDLGL